MAPFMVPFGYGKYFTWSFSAGLRENSKRTGIASKGALIYGSFLKASVIRKTWIWMLRGSESKR